MSCSADNFSRSITDYGVCYTTTMDTPQGEMYETGTTGNGIIYEYKSTENARDTTSDFPYISLSQAIYDEKHDFTQNGCMLII